MRADLTAYPYGLPLYHEELIRIVEAYAPSEVRPETLSRKDLANFLAGMESHNPRIAVLDAYMQIVNRSLRETFFPEPRVSTFGLLFSDYCGGTGNEMQNTDLDSHWVGVYQIVDVLTTAEKIAFPLSLIVVKKFEGSDIARVYSFVINDSADMDSDEFNGVTLSCGFCALRDHSIPVLFRKFIDQTNSLGVITNCSTPYEEYRQEKPVRVLKTRGFGVGIWVGITSQLAEDIHDNGGKTSILRKISDEAVSQKSLSIIDRLEYVW